MMPVQVHTLQSMAQTFNPNPNTGNAWAGWVWHGQQEAWGDCYSYESCDDCKSWYKQESCHHCIGVGDV